MAPDKHFLHVFYSYFQFRTCFKKQNKCKLAFLNKAYYKSNILFIKNTRTNIISLCGVNHES